MTQLEKIPSGFTQEYNNSIWNWSFLFFWSPIFKRWVDLNRTITVRPNETIEEALIREKVDPNYTIFFSKEKK